MTPCWCKRTPSLVFDSVVSVGALSETKSTFPISPLSVVVGESVVVVGESVLVVVDGWSVVIELPELVALPFLKKILVAVMSSKDGEGLFV